MPKMCFPRLKHEGLSMVIGDEVEGSGCGGRGGSDRVLRMTAAVPTSTWCAGAWYGPAGIYNEVMQRDKATDGNTWWIGVGLGLVCGMLHNQGHRVRSTIKAGWGAAVPISDVLVGVRGAFQEG